LFIPAYPASSAFKKMPRAVYTPPPTRNRSPPVPAAAFRRADSRATIDGAARGGRFAACRSGVW
jgi:hypothetical protein